ncbi:hypothetical protein RDI58_017713 [Solanum bulbocastanum]|uniref:Uncharacterized protein n=1 Tax=Solanum bulbocastanum TaxID=147425 RepID=A0AAN8TAC5_SOLBU
MIGVDEGDDDPTKLIVLVKSIENYTFVAFTSPAITVRGFAPIEILGAPSQLSVYDTKSLFLEDEDDHAVVIKTIAETPTVRIVEPGSELTNWICISAPVRREFQ